MEKYGSMAQRGGGGRHAHFPGVGVGGILLHSPWQTALLAPDSCNDTVKSMKWLNVTCSLGAGRVAFGTLVFMLSFSLRFSSPFFLLFSCFALLIKLFVSLYILFIFIFLWKSRDPPSEKREYISIPRIPSKILILPTDKRQNGLENILHHHHHPSSVSPSSSSSSSFSSSYLSDTIFQLFDLRSCFYSLLLFIFIFFFRRYVW